MRKLATFMQTMALAAAMMVAAGHAARAEETIRIAESDWTGSLIDANLAKVIMEEHLGLKVKLVFADYTAQWSGLASGGLDAALEMWPSYSLDTYQKFVKEKKVVEDIGPFGIVGKTGWFVPTYVIKGDPARSIAPMAPDLSSYKDLNKYKKLFSRPETGDMGMLIELGPSWKSGDPERAKNLGLEYKVVYAGAEGAWAAEIESAFAKGKPLLFYLWSPHWIAGRYDVTEITFPEYTDECYGVNTTKPASYACAFPIEDTYSAVRSGFKEDHPKAYKFLKAMKLTNEMQQEMLVMIEVEKMKVDKAVRKWMDKHPDVWKSWIQ